jgi:hypothetical protein
MINAILSIPNLKSLSVGISSSTNNDSNAALNKLETILKNRRTTYNKYKTSE